MRGESSALTLDENETEQLGVTSMAEGDPAIEGNPQGYPASLSPAYCAKTNPATRLEKRAEAVDYSRGKIVAPSTASHDDA